MVPVLDLTRRRAVAACALAAAALGGCSSHIAIPAQSSALPASTLTPSTTVPVPADAQSARVRAIVDGDTLHLVGSGSGPLPASDERVRLLEINAPEIHGTVECFGPEATTALTRLTPVGSTVHVAADRELRDKYGRPLLYVWNADGLFVNAELVRSGAAVPLLIAPNDHFIGVIRAAEGDARGHARGQWAACPR